MLYFPCRLSLSIESLNFQLSKRTVFLDITTFESTRFDGQSGAEYWTSEPGCTVAFQAEGAAGETRGDVAKR